jgi:cephalosporin hydroxylase
MKRPHALWWAAPLAVGLCDRGPAASRATHPSDHRTDRLHTESYHRLVAVGCYLIVEDTNVNGHPVLPDFGPGPRKAVERFLGAHPEFVVDPDRERSMLTLNPGGYLRRAY